MGAIASASAHLTRPSDPHALRRQVAALRLYKLKMHEWERALARSRQGGGGLTATHTQTSGWERALARGKNVKPRRKVKRGTGAPRKQA